MNIQLYQMANKDLLKKIPVQHQNGRHSAQASMGYC